MTDFDSYYLLDQFQRFKSQRPVRSEFIGARDLEISAYVRRWGRPSKAGLNIGGREMGAFVANDLDWVLYDYRNQMLRLLEVKTRGANLSYSQRQLWTLLNSMLRIGSEHMTEHGLSQVSYGGLSVLRMENTTPANSAWIKWDEQPITREETWRRVNMLDMLEGAA